jgi:hypothetical protein
MPKSLSGHIVHDLVVEILQMTYDLYATSANAKNDVDKFIYRLKDPSKTPDSIEPIHAKFEALQTQLKNYSVEELANKSHEIYKINAPDESTLAECHAVINRARRNSSLQQST